MGAITTLALAGTAPDLPAAILLEDPPPSLLTPNPDNGPERERRSRMAAGLVALKRQTRDELLAGVRTLNPGWSEAELQPWADAKARVSPNAGAIFTPGTSAPVDWPPLLRRITCPALLLTADPDRGAIMTPDAAATLQALIPQLRIVHIPGAGHNIRRDQLNPYLEAVHAFLAEIPRTPATATN